MARKYDDRTLKILFGQAAGRCAFPQCSSPLIANRTPGDEPAVLGQIAHIIARSDSGPRGDASFPQNARDKEPNLVLLCPYHHALVDAHDSTYSAEDLRRWKRELIGDLPDAASLVQAALEKVRQQRQVEAVDFFERALGCAQDDDVDTRRLAHFRAAMGLINAMSEGSLASDSEAISRVEQHLRSAAEAGASKAKLLIAQAWLAQIQRNYNGMLVNAQQARLAEGASAAERADALNAQLAALHALGRDDDVDALCGGVAKDALAEAGPAVDEPHFQLAVTRLIVMASSAVDLSDEVGEATSTFRTALDNGSEIAMSPTGTAHRLNELTLVLTAHGHMREALEVVKVAHEYAVCQPEAGLTLTVALQAAELTAYFEEELTRRFLDSADRAAGLIEGRDGDSRVFHDTLIVFTRGKCLSILADRSGDPVATAAFLSDALDELHRVIEIVEANRSELMSKGVDVLLVDIRYWAGHAAAGLGRHEEATSHFRAAHTEAVEVSSPIWRHRALPAWLDEAKMLLLSGQLADAHATLRAVSEAIAALLTPEPGDGQLIRLYRRVQSMLDHMETYQIPVFDWMDSQLARDIGRTSREGALRENVASQVAPLVSWWRWWTQAERDGGPLAELFDFWGRGGLCRVAAAVRGSPHRAVTVDARSVHEIRQWVRILCPLFDTVIVKWKAPLHDGVVICPLKVDYEGPGGHGYDVTNEFLVRAKAGQPLDQGIPEWVTTVSSASLVGPDVATFLAHEASALVEAGRLVIVPAPLVGCTQSATGWTDSLFVDGLLGGAVSVIDAPDIRRTPEPQRVLDLAAAAVPYIDNVSMADLARVLQEVDSWLGPLRAVVLGALGSGDIGHERWDRITILEDEINDACRELEARYNKLVAAEPERQWRVHQVDSVTAAVERPRNTFGPSKAADPITETLRMLAAPDAHDPAPWIPYWRLRGVGGHLHWSCPLDNRVRATVERQAEPRLPVSSWLHPGTAGFGIRPVIG